MSNLDQLLPQRNLRFHRAPLAQALVHLLLAILPLVAAVAIAWWQWPGLARDYAIRNNPFELSDYDLREGKCTTRKAIFTNCEADVAYVVDGQRHEAHIELMFVSFSSGDYSASLVVDSDEPSKATLSIGLDHYWNRVIVFVLFAGGLAWLGLALVRSSWRIGAANRRARTPQRWQPQVVAVEAVKQSLGRTLVTYRYPSGRGKRTAQAYARFRGGESPLFLRGEDDAPLALALRPAEGGIPALLDEGLQRIDLTPAERAAAQAALAPSEDADA